jgi:hypothetical protein
MGKRGRLEIDPVNLMSGAIAERQLHLPIGDDYIALS